MESMQVVEVNGLRVLTTKQIALAYEVAEKLIRKNFENNKVRYEEGKHYIWLTGRELKDFLHTTNLRLQNQSKVRHMYLWTEKGALLHAKSLNTDKAWEVYDYLVDFYFREVLKAKNNCEDTVSNAVVPCTSKIERIPEDLVDKSKNIIIPEISDPIRTFRILLDKKRESK